MSDLNLSKVEIPLKSKSMSNQQSPKKEIISIKQIGDYILGEEIGSGAFGKVLLGKHILTEEKVAIKILDKMILNETPEDYELVKKEISILKIVKHKYIVQLYEIMQTAQHIFIIMEYCEGKEILDYILRKNRLSELESLKYFQQLINCLFYLHSQNIAHRDIKIDNMLLDGNKDLKLIDFGLSTKYTDDDLLDQPCGTVVYAIMVCWLMFGVVELFCMGCFLDIYLFRKKMMKKINNWLLKEKLLCLISLVIKLRIY